MWFSATRPWRKCNFKKQKWAEDQTRRAKRRRFNTLKHDAVNNQLVQRGGHKQPTTNNKQQARDPEMFAHVGCKFI